jgi:hypothetical protein
MDISAFRQQWRYAKENMDTLAQSGNKQIKAVLRTFNQGLGPALDKWMKAGQTGNKADFHKYGEQALRIITDYEKRIGALPTEAWGDTNEGRRMRVGAVGRIEAVKEAVEAALKKYA